MAAKTPEENTMLPRIEHMRDHIASPYALTCAVIRPDGSATIEVLQTFTGVRQDFQAPAGGYFEPTRKNVALQTVRAVAAAEWAARRDLTAA